MSRNNKFRKGGTLGNLTLTPAQAARLKSDSKPVVFTEQDLRDILGDQSRHLSYTPPLDFLNISTVRSCMNEALRGAYAHRICIFIMFFSVCHIYAQLVYHDASKFPLLGKATEVAGA